MSHQLGELGGSVGGHLGIGSESGCIVGTVVGLVLLAHLGFCSPDFTLTLLGYLIPELGFPFLHSFGFNNGNGFAIEALLA